jgi:hypothetical protein
MVNANSRPDDRPLTIRRFTACMLWIGLAWNLAVIGVETLAFRNTSGVTGVGLRERHVDFPANLPFLPAAVDVGLNLDGPLDDAMEPTGGFAAAWGVQSVLRTWRSAGCQGMKAQPNQWLTGTRFARLRC